MKLIVLALFQTVVFSDDQDLDGLVWMERSHAAAEETHGGVVAAIAGGHEAMADWLEECAE